MRNTQVSNDVSFPRQTSRGGRTMAQDSANRAESFQAHDLSHVRCQRRATGGDLHKIQGRKVHIDVSFHFFTFYFLLFLYNHTRSLCYVRHMYRCAKISEWGDRLPLHYERQQEQQQESSKGDDITNKTATVK